MRVGLKEVQGRGLSHFDVLRLLPCTWGELWGGLSYVSFICHSRRQEGDTHKGECRKLLFNGGGRDEDVDHHHVLHFRWWGRREHVDHHHVPLRREARLGDAALPHRLHVKRGRVAHDGVAIPGHPWLRATALTRVSRRIVCATMLGPPPLGTGTPSTSPRGESVVLPPWPLWLAGPLPLYSVISIGRVVITSAATTGARGG